MQCCNTQLKIYEENLPFYRILNSITKNTNDINEALLHPNKEDPTKYKQLLEQHNKNIEIGLNQLEKLDKYPSTGYFIDRSILPSDVNGLGDVYLRGKFRNALKHIFLSNFPVYRIFLQIKKSFS